MPLYLTEKFMIIKKVVKPKYFNLNSSLEGSTNFFRKKNITNNTQKNRSMSIKKDFKKEVLFLANKGQNNFTISCTRSRLACEKKMLSHLKSH